MAETIQIDIWGHVKGESDQYRVKPPYEVQTDVPADGDGYIYHRFFNECPCAIHRDVCETVSGRIKVQKQVAYGDWDSRDTLSYSTIDKPFLSVYRQEIYAENQTFNATAGTAFSFDLVASLRYGTDTSTISCSIPSSSASLPEGASLSGKTISGTVTTAGTYVVTIDMIAPLAKKKSITVTLVVS